MKLSLQQSGFRTVNLLKGLLPVAGALLALSPFTLRADVTHLDFHPLSGDAPTVIKTESINRIEFQPGGELFLYSSPYLEGATVINPLTLSKIVFSDAPIQQVGISAPKSPRINLYPNPASDSFRISGMEETDLELTSLSGAQMMTIPQYNGNSIDISNLPAGIYIVKAGNFTSKLIKK